MTIVKENPSARGALRTRWLVLAALGTLAALALAAHQHEALPAPLGRDAPPHRFRADVAYDHLLNLTSIGPRVAGSYENEVAAVRMLVAAVREAARGARHNRVELDVHTASGAFSLDFFDGMTNVYRDVQSVVARVAGRAGRPRATARRALLFNCHYDTVPDSPGASDDGAGCAVLLEVLRALAEAPQPLRHDAVFLFNGAEENIMQASHAFVTTHKWARSARAFINIEACGAGGREVLFQAGPHDPWIIEMYADVVPHPFASSLAQEMFESGFIPADTDFRIFRDFGNLSGVDLAWSANGYVYHTALDTAERVPRGSLQRTGDNVLALARGLLSSEWLESAVDPGARQPVFFDVLGVALVTARPPAALAAAGAAAALVLLRLHLGDNYAVNTLHMRRGAWWRLTARALLALGAALAAALLAAAGVALALHAAGARLAFYARAWLLAPLYALPALCAAAALGRRLLRGAVPGSHWGAARLAADAGAAAWGGALLLCAARGLRSGFVPLLWALLPTVADLLATLCLPASPRSEARRAWFWCAGSALPVLQTCYLALGSLAMFVPLMGRTGAAPVPPDVMMAVMVSALALTAASWLLPLVVAATSIKKLVYGGACVTLASMALVLCAGPGAAYGAARPQRFMLLHARRTAHAPAPRHRHDLHDQRDQHAAVQHFYWIPELDVNTPHSVDDHVAGMRGAAAGPTAAECARRPYCGAPYPLPVRALVPRAHRLRAPPAPAQLAASLLLARRPHPAQRDLLVNVTGASHVVLVVAPAAGARVTWLEARGAGGAAPREAAAWGARRTYFIALHAARPPTAWQLTLRIQHELETPPEHWVDVSLAAHGMSRERAAPHAAMLAAFPAWCATTGWPVDLHLYTL